MKIAELLGGAAIEWRVTIKGRDELGELQRAQLRIEKGFKRLTSGEIGLSIDDGKRIMTLLQELVVKQELATYALARRVCPECERLRPVKDYTVRKIRTVFGSVEVKNPRWMLCQRSFLTHAWRSQFSARFVPIRPRRNVTVHVPFVQ
jgi:hypothetical protein